ncbi:MAG TPA: hypothetical protein VH249_24980 [Xanthobacteraceae bacterium]|jgi:hypothetical protein|nr:hypothetical protein [Xanthobacteraceae bacterium]
MTRRRNRDAERGLTWSRDRKDEAVRPQKQSVRGERSTGQGLENDERGQLQPGDKERAQKNR